MRSPALILAMFQLASVAAIANDADIFDAVEHHYADNDGVKLHYVTLGQGDPILFVHGFPDVWFAWAHQMDGLKDDYKVAAMDMRAYNKSDKPEGVENYGMELLIGDVVSVIDALGGNVTLVVPTSSSRTKSVSTPAWFSHFGMHGSYTRW